MSEFSKEVIEMNNEIVDILKPVIAFMGIMMLLGILGNPFVLYIYGCRLEVSTSHIFITALALADIIVCIIAMPLEILDLVRFYTFNSKACCILLRYLTNFSSLFSAIILFAIVVDRYRKICQPFKRQLSLKHSKICVCVTIAVTMVLSLPCFVIYDIISVDLSHNGSVMSGSDCGFNREDYGLFINIYNGLLLICFVILVIALITMYGLVGWKLYKVRRTRVFFVERKFPNDVSLEISVQNRITRKPLTELSCINTGTHATRNFDDSHKKFEGRRISKITKTDSKTMSVHKYTVVMFSITVAYILSFLPFLVIMTLQSASGTQDQSKSDSEFVAHHIFVRSFFINSAINPYIYGFLNREFRQVLFSVFRSKCK